MSEVSTAINSPSIEKLTKLDSSDQIPVGRPDVNKPQVVQAGTLFTLLKDWLNFTRLDDFGVENGKPTFKGDPWPVPAEISEALITILSDIESLKEVSVVADVVSDHAALLAYDKSLLTNRDIIKVISDETLEGKVAWWRIVSKNWVLVTTEEPKRKNYEPLPDGNIKNLEANKRYFGSVTTCAFILPQVTDDTASEIWVSLVATGTPEITFGTDRYYGGEKPVLTAGSWSVGFIWERAINRWVVGAIEI